MTPTKGMWCAPRVTWSWADGVLHPNTVNIVSRSRARVTGQETTADRVKSFIHSTEPNEWTQHISRKYHELMESGTMGSTVAGLPQEYDPFSDYGAHMQNLLSQPWVHEKHLGYLVSAVGTLNRRKAKASWTRGYTKDVGEPISGVRATVVKNKTITWYDEYRHRDVTRSRLTLRDEEGHQMVWWASREVDVGGGDVVSFTSGKVKKHDRYRHVDQTVITRPRFDVVGHCDDDDDE